MKRQDKDWKDILEKEYAKRHFLDRFNLSIHEISELGIAWVISSVILVVVFYRESFVSMIAEGTIPDGFLITLFAFGITFFVHELMHKFTAIKYGAKAYYQITRQGIIIALIGLIIGFPIIAIGAVFWWGESSSSIGIRGRVSAAGPISNLTLIGFFMCIQGLAFLTMESLGELGFLLERFGQAGIMWNIFLGGFNMLPIGVLDGAKVLDWNPKIWIALFGSFIVLGIFTGSLFGFL
jgi:Zn-dependent protease